MSVLSPFLKIGMTLVSLSICLCSIDLRRALVRYGSLCLYPIMIVLSGKLFSKIYDKKMRMKLGNSQKLDDSNQFFSETC